MKKKIFALLLAMLLLCAACASAEGKLVVDQKQLYLIEGTEYGYFYAKVENTGDAAVGIDDGKFVGFSASDDIILSQSYLSTSPSSMILQPGEYAYVAQTFWEEALKDSPVTDFKFSISEGSYSIAYEKVPCEATFDFKGVDTYENYLYVTFTNTTEQPQYDFYITAALLDASGNILYVTTNSLSSIALHPGSAVTVKIYMDDTMLKYYQAHDLTPASVDAMVYYRAEEE